MIVKARAVILIDGRLIVANQRRRGHSELSLPGGRVNAPAPKGGRRECNSAASAGPRQSA